MGSRLSRQSSLDNENFSKKRRKLLDGAGEGERSSGGGGDFLFALMLKSDKLPGMLRRTNHSPYTRRVAWIKEIQKLLRDRRIEQATDVLKLLRKVRGNCTEQQSQTSFICRTYTLALSLLWCSWQSNRWGTVHMCECSLMFKLLQYLWVTSGFSVQALQPVL